MYWPLSICQLFYGTQDIPTPELPDILLFICTFAIGYLVSVFVNLSSRFKFKKLIKHLNSTLDSQQKELTGLKSEIESLRAATVEPDKEPAIPLEPPFVEETPAALEDTSESPKEQKEDEEEKKTDV